jgi:hypothetical protein
MNRGWPAALLAGGLLGFAAAAYPALWRDRCLTWGARDDEVLREMPGDRFLPAASVVTTRAIGVDAPASAVWPWLVQMGSGRGGAYTYDWIENFFGLNMHSAQEVIPRLQDLAVDDEIPLGKGQRMRVEVLEPGHALVVRSIDGAWVWSFGLYPEGPSAPGKSLTRLVSRNRIRLPETGPVSGALWLYLMEPGSLIMERKMLHGIKDRAERLAKTGRPGLPSHHPAASGARARNQDLSRNQALRPACPAAPRAERAAPGAAPASGGSRTDWPSTRRPD